MKAPARAVAFVLWLGLGLCLGAGALRAQEDKGDGDGAVDRATHAARPTRDVPLARGSFEVYDLPPEGKMAGLPAPCVVVFASGDGGWTYWEDRVCRHLARHGCYVLGLDTARYAEQPLTQDDLAADFERIAAAAPAPLVASGAPVFFGGYAGGAGQAVAAAALLPRPPRLAGLLLVNPRSRGRYGVAFADRFGFPIRGAGTFPLAGLAASLGPLAVAQLHATGNAAWLEYDDIGWSEAVPGPHRRFDYPEDWRHLGRATPPLLASFDAAIDWLATQVPAPAPATPSPVLP